MPCAPLPLAAKYECVRMELLQYEARVNHGDIALKPLD